MSFSPWKPVFFEHTSAPARLIAVDKSQQRLFVFERHSPLARTREYVCTTGRAQGDKIVEGDLKTPEGVYFILQHIGSGLDYLKYGNEAYTLNYPNPMDRLRQKTGYGIWIHGRGEPLVPLQTEGCVAMINEDLAAMNAILTPGTPVALTSSFSFGTAGEKETVRLLEKKVRDWAQAWSSRSEGLFDFYAKEAYGVAQGEPFSRFQAQKERLFKILPWIRISLRDIQVLQGPGYWVTWFYQEYQAPNLTTKGVRRLYWIKDAGGEFKIAGMEWTPGMTTGTLLASAEPAVPPVEARPRTEEQDADARKAAPPAPVPPAGPDHVEDPSMGTVAEPPLASLLMVLNRDGRQIPYGDWAGKQDVPEREMVVPPVVASVPARERAIPLSDAPAPETRVAEAAPLAAAKSGGAPEATALVSRPDNTAPDSGLPASDHASPVQAPRPASPVPPLSPPAAPAGTDPRSLTPDSPPPATGQTPDAAGETPSPSQAEHGPVAAASSAQTVFPPLANRSIYNQPATDIFYPPGETPEPENAPRALDPVAAAPAPAPVSGAEHPAPSAPRLHASDRNQAAPQASPDARADKLAEAESASRAAAVAGLPATVERWRKAWEAGDLEAYMSFYAPGAVQGARAGARAIRNHKKNLWAKAKPARVALSDVRIVVKDATVLADMRQEYADAKGLSDTGVKTLTFENIQGAWVITREDWSPIIHEAGN